MNGNNALLILNLTLNIILSNLNKIDSGYVYYIQRFVVKHNDIYYCERDDGGKDRLVGYEKCEKNVDNLKYYG